jgi:hypothetical protein
MNIHTTAISADFHAKAQLFLGFELGSDCIKGIKRVVHSAVYEYSYTV